MIESWQISKIDKFNYIAHVWVWAMFIWVTKKRGSNSKAEKKSGWQSWAQLTLFYPQGESCKYWNKL